MHIAIDGCIGVGKTTLATGIAQLFNSKLLLEEFEKNPFLNEFYTNPAENIFETEMQFLLLHYHQLKGRQGKIPKRFVSDFTFLKNSIFAEVNLVDADEKKIFFRLYDFLLRRLPSPDLIIFLKGSDALIANRIRQRNRLIEQVIDTSYFLKLNKAYNDFYAKSNLRIHMIDADSFDCLNNPECLNELRETIQKLLPMW